MASRIKLYKFIPEKDRDILSLNYLLADKIIVDKKCLDIKTREAKYNPQNEMFSHFGTKRYNFKNETQLFKVTPHTSKNQKKSTGFAGTKYI